jgi:hypothetical protein
MREPTAAQALWGHLRQGTPEPVKQRTPGLGDALWPSLSRATKAAEADQRLWSEIVRRNRDDFVRWFDARYGKR